MTAGTDNNHFQQKPRREAQYINPPNILREKVGVGGLHADILKKAQSLIDNNSFDYRPHGEIALETLLHAITNARATENRADENLIYSILVPVMDLKTSGGMFHYPLISKIADKLVQFLEVIEKLDDTALEIVESFYTTIRAIFIAQMKSEISEKGIQLHDALVAACNRYFEKNPVKTD